MVRANISFKVGSLDNLEGQDVMSLLDRIMRRTCQLTKKNVSDEIERAVPKDTGLLRAVMQSSLATSEFDGSRINLHFHGTSYAQYVDNYDTSQVRHAIDPEAEGQYAEHMFKEAKFRLRLNWEIAKITLRAS